MRRFRKRLIGISAGIVLLGVATPAGAWQALTNPPSTWQSLPVPYYVENSGCGDIGGFDAAVTVCEASFDSWENAPCTSWRVEYRGGTSASPMNNRDGQWVQGWVESGWPYGGSAIGVTMSMYGSGVIWGCDITYNAANYTWSLSGGMGYTVDSQSIVTHEEGHFLGLNDLYSCLPDPQTMCGYYSGGTGSRTLTDDDIAGVCALYPGSGPPPDCTLDTDCDDKYVCVDGDCIGQMCALCTVHEDCGDGDDYCLTGFTDGNFYCGVSCFSDAECGTGNSCIDLGGGVRQCLPTSFDCTGSSTGCTVDTECPMGYLCEGGACVPQPTPECTVNEDCAVGYICVDQHCVLDTSPHNPVCTQCTVNEECGYDSDHCITFYPDGQPFSTGLSYCGRSCDSVGGDCGPGFACYEFPDRPGQCLPEDKTCTRCDPVWMTGCLEGYYCDFVNCFSGVCRPGGPGPKPLGDTCSDDQECNSLQCVRQVDDSFCSAACSFIPGADSCSMLDPAFTCQPREFGACGYCSCASGRLGDACNRDSDCQSGGCMLLPGQENGGDKACTMYCGTGVSCPPYFECQYTPSGAWGCFPPAGMVLRPGEPCDGTLHCLGGTCNLELGYCTRSCDGKCECPADMHCEDNGDVGRHCVTGAPAKSGCGCRVIGLSAGDGPGAAFGIFILAMLALAFQIFRKRLIS